MTIIFMPNLYPFSCKVNLRKRKSLRKKKKFMRHQWTAKYICKWNCIHFHSHFTFLTLSSFITREWLARRRRRVYWWNTSYLKQEKATTMKLARKWGWSGEEESTRKSCVKYHWRANDTFLPQCYKVGWVFFIFFWLYLLFYSHLLFIWPNWRVRVSEREKLSSSIELIRHRDDAHWSTCSVIIVGDHLLHSEQMVRKFCSHTLYSPCIYTCVEWTSYFGTFSSALVSR